jgi:protoheme IX farnesyltransferase
LVLPASELGWIYGVSAAILGLAFLAGTIALARQPSEKGSMKLFTFSITYLSLLFIMLTIDVLVN